MCNSFLDRESAEERYRDQDLHSCMGRRLPMNAKIKSTRKICTCTGHLLVDVVAPIGEQRSAGVRPRVPRHCGREDQRNTESSQLRRTMQSYVQGYFCKEKLLVWARGGRVNVNLLQINLEQKILIGRLRAEGYRDTLIHRIHEICCHYFSTL